jgi:subtilisin
MRIWIALMAVAAFLVGCETPKPVTPSLNLTPKQATRNQNVTAQLTGLSGVGAKVFIESTEVTVVSASANSLVFKVPGTAAIGSQTVSVQSGNSKVQDTLKVLGDLGSDVSASEVMVTVSQGITQGVFQNRLTGLNLGLTLLEFKSLGGSGPCSRAIARISIPAGQSVGSVLDRLAQSDLNDVVFQADPQSLWGMDQVVDPIDAIGVPAARIRKRNGNGSTIAVLDTGVSKHPLIAQRLQAGYDFVDDDPDPSDNFDDPSTQLDPDGHGTAVAVLAAGDRLGVAPLAQVLPIRICDQNGLCLASNAIKGVCYALAKADPKKLVLNLSFGGSTPVEGLRAVLQYALEQKALVAAAAGNQGKGGPTHYPAAYSLPGLVAVGALRQTAAGGWAPADFSTRGNYLDLAAPGQDLSSGNPQGSISLYTGTSFSTPLVAGALALWREAKPDDTAAQIETQIKANVQALPFTELEVGKGMLDLSVNP